MIPLSNVFSGACPVENTTLIPLSNLFARDYYDVSSSILENLYDFSLCILVSIISPLLTFQFQE